MIGFRVFILLFMGGGYAYASFEDDVQAYLTQDFPGQNVRVVWEKPDVLSKLPLGLSIEKYTKYDGEKVSFQLEGQDKPILGKVEVMVDIPVLKNPMAKGSIITEDDIAFQCVPLSTLPGDAILHKEMLFGKAPKDKVHPPRTPVRTQDLAAPKVIKRGDVVNVLYQSAHMELRTKAKAMKDGMAGERISLEIQKNSQNLGVYKDKKTIDAVVQDAHTVFVKVGV